ncbi:MAG TPA: S-adenosylmethionine:tRNA ribosyltransferase-isomerase [Lentimicrobium sp.]|nr:S-adenosylmethionine:tRNA ribosyltransferase-isomerase [Lentimicrobium sp.]
MIHNIPISNYNYDLPENRIARFPLEQRDETKLLVFRGGNITDSYFNAIEDFIPEGSLLIFNDTRVIKARLVFHKEGGARIEVFCLNELESGEGFARWKCYVGNAKKWKKDDLFLHFEGYPALTAKKEMSTDDSYIVLFTWHDKTKIFEDILELYGKVPLPPYLNREPVEQDRGRYQTIYAKYDGSVAAPTAGLHFTDHIFGKLENKSCTIDYVTLHVGAGTFKPVSSGNAAEHQMHEEKIIIHRDTVLRLIDNLDKDIIPVGTTSMRTLESLYWLGHQIITGREKSLNSGSFYIDQWEPYNKEDKIHTADALTAVYDYMKKNHLQEISGDTRIMIVPGYEFRICKALVTNFHQPQSTLLLLVSAFIGENWKKVYDHALNNNYRFLSYGDGCLLVPKE